MVKKILKYSLLTVGSFFMAGLASCANEEIIQESTDKQDKDKGLVEFDLPGYMGIRIDMGEGTRADDSTPSVGDSFDQGSLKENALAPSTDAEAYHYIMLYGGDGNLQMIIPMDTRKWSTENSAGSRTDVTVVVRKAYKSTFFGQNLPSGTTLDPEDYDDFEAYLNSLTVYALVNFDKSLVTNKEEFEDFDLKNTLEFLSDCTIEDLYNIRYGDYLITAKDLKGVSTKYFTMASAMYATGATISPAYDIDTSKIYYTEDNALNGSPAINAIVERLAVKYELNVGENDELPIAGEQVKVFRDISTSGDYEIIWNYYDWKAIVEGFGINGLEQDAYLFKNIGTPLDWANTQSSLQRYYWSEDPHYEVTANTIGEGNILLPGSKNGYPHQYRDALETDSIRSYNQNPADFYLRYVNYNSLTSKPEFLYSLENTYKDLTTFTKGENNSYFADGLGPKNYFTAGTHFLLACRLQLGTNTTERDIYRDEDDIYYGSEDHLKRAKLTLLNDRDLAGGSADIRVLNVNWGYDTSNGEHNYSHDLRVLDWPKGARLYYKPTGGNLREVIYTDLTVIPAKITGGDGKVLISPKESLIRGGDFYLWASETEHRLVTPNELISLFHKTMGAFDLFSGGRMYYCAPVTHRVSSIDKKESWMTVGHIGAVRNNWYKVTVTGVMAPGHSVASVADPIIPLLDTSRDYLSSRVRVFRWHEVTTTVTPVASN